MVVIFGFGQATRKIWSNKSVRLYFVLYGTPDRTVNVKSLCAADLRKR